MFSTNEKCKEEMKHWQIDIDYQPTKLTGQKIAAGNLLMGD